MASKASSPVKRTFVTLLKIGAYAAVVGLVALVVAVSIAMSQLPSYQDLIRRDDLGQMIRVRANDGTVIVSLGPSFGEWLSYNEIPPIMREAMIAVEDRRFQSHPGVDPSGIARAVKVRVDRGSWVQGGSTITQQLARNIFLTNSRTFGRKVKEGVLALAIEWKFSKDQILELYLNKVYFGGGAYGIDSASRKFFSHSARELSTAEAAIRRSVAEDVPAGVIVIEAWSDESTFTVFRDAEYRVNEDGSPHRLSDFTFPAGGAWPDPKGMTDDLHARGIRLHAPSLGAPWRNVRVQFRDGVMRSRTRSTMSCRTASPRPTRRATTPTSCPTPRTLRPLQIMPGV